MAILYIQGVLISMVADGIFLEIKERNYFAQISFCDVCAKISVIHACFCTAE